MRPPSLSLKTDSLISFQMGVLFCRSNLVGKCSSSRRQDSDLELGGAEIAQGRVPSLAIVENLNVLENVAPGFIAGQVVAMMHQFGLQGVEKAFHWSIIPAVSLATH